MDPTFFHSFPLLSSLTPQASVGKEKKRQTGNVIWNNQACMFEPCLSWRLNLAAIERYHLKWWLQICRGHLMMYTRELNLWKTRETWVCNKLEFFVFSFTFYLQKLSWSGDGKRSILRPFDFSEWAMVSSAGRWLVFSWTRVREKTSGS